MYCTLYILHMLYIMYIACQHLDVWDMRTSLLTHLGLGVERSRFYFRTFGVPRTFWARTFGAQPRTFKNPEGPKTPNVQNLNLIPNVQNPECPKPRTLNRCVTIPKIWTKPNWKNFETEKFWNRNITLCPQPRRSKPQVSTTPKVRQGLSGVFFT